MSGSLGMRMIIAGNWKMHTDRESALVLVQDVVRGIGRSHEDVEVWVAPPFPFLEMTVQAAAGSGVRVAAQNCHMAKQGAYTGEVSAAMLKSVGVSGCIIGHSERRQYFGETDAQVCEKIKALHEAGLQAIYCCGEVKEEREQGRHFEVVARQLKEALGSLPAAVVQKVIVAYEPVWAIGTGLTATAEQAQEMHAFIRSELQAMVGDGAARMPILYGGSCKPENAEGIFAGADVNGGLIGGAALDGASFADLVRNSAERMSA